MKLTRPYNNEYFTGNTQMNYTFSFRAFYRAVHAVALAKILKYCEYKRGQAI